MSRLLAIEIAGTEVRGALLEGSGAPARVSKMFTVARTTAGGAKALADEVHKQVAGIKKSRTSLVIVVGGGEVQLRLLTLPTNDERELPNMVQLQAEREFPSADELVLDYVPVDSPTPGSTRVLVARLSDEIFVAAQALAAELELPLTRIVLRPLAATNLVGRLVPAARSGVQLVATRCPHGLDLVLSHDDKPMLVRQVLGDAAGVDPAIRQTLLAARGQFAETTINGVQVLEDSRQETTPPREGAPTVSRTPLRPGIDKLLVLDSGAELADSAGLLGALLDEAAHITPAIDFLHPKQPVIDTAPARRQRLLAGAAAATLLLGGWWGYSRVANLDADLASVNAQLASVKKETEKFEPYLAQAAEIEKWRGTNVNWLEELTRLSNKLRPQPLDSKEFPVESDVLVTSLLATSRPVTGTTGGRLELKAAARDRSKLSELESRLRDPEHPLEPLSVENSPAEGEYKWSVQYVVGVPPAATEQETEEAAP